MPPNIVRDPDLVALRGVVVFCPVRSTMLLIAERSDHFASGEPTAFLFVWRNREGEWGASG